MTTRDLVLLGVGFVLGYYLWPLVVLYLLYILCVRDQQPPNHA